MMFTRVLAVILLLTMSTYAKEKEMSTIYDFEVETITGEKITLGTYRGKVMLIVNVASKCGFTPQYEGLESLYETYRERGLVVLGFPCNQFSSQEPGTELEIRDFCTVNFGVTFPMFAKIEVNGDNAHPLYIYLKSQKSGFLGSESIKWNFTKFLVDRDGDVIERYGSVTEPKSIAKDIEKLLEK